MSGKGRRIEIWKRKRVGFRMQAALREDSNEGEVKLVKGLKGDRLGGAHVTNGARDEGTG